MLNNTETTMTKTMDRALNLAREYARETTDPATASQILGQIATVLGSTVPGAVWRTMRLSESDARRLFGRHGMEIDTVVASARDARGLA